ncbi:MAG: hypothetical protein AAFV54_05145 [Pseudomonadota bacterium]
MMKLSEFGRLGAVRSWLAMSASIFALAACGGGDGTAAAPPPVASPPPPPPPPVSTNTAPVATILTDNATPDEGQPFMVDASSSTDPDNDNLTFMWTQTAGPDLEITDPTSPTQSFTAPELTETVMVTFEVEVSDGELVNTATVNIQLVNIDFEPNDPSLQAPTSILAPSGLMPMVFAEADLFSRALAGEIDALGDVRFFNLEFDTVEGELVEGDGFLVTPTFTPPLRVAQHDIFRAFPGGGLINFAVIQEQLGRVSLLGRIINSSNTGQPLETVITIDADNACAYVETSSSTFAIGRRQGGLVVGSISRTPGAPSIGLTNLNADISELDESQRSFCELMAIESPVLPQVAGLPSPISSFREPPAGRLLDLLAFETDSNEVVLFRGAVDATTNMETYKEVVSMPIDLGGVDGLKLVASRQLGVGLAERAAIALVFSDGAHDGTHLLVILGLDPDRNIVQRNYVLPRGVPADVHQSGGRVVVISSTSPEAVIFTQPEIGVPFVTAPNFLAYEGPTFAEIGLGAGTSIGTSNRPPGTQIAFPEKNEIRQFDLVD